MFWNYLKSALRNLRKNKLFAVINIAGLALGLTIYVFGGLLVEYEQTHDRFFKKADRIYTIGSYAAEGLDVGVDLLGSVFSTVGPIIKTELSDVEMVARTETREFLIKTGAEGFYQGIQFADPELLKIFDFNYIHGDDSALEDPSGMVITEAMAIKFFGTTDVRGEVVTLDNEFDFNVAAVIRDVPLNSHFSSTLILGSSLQILAPIKALSRMREFDEAGNWDNLSVGNMTYVLLPEHLDGEWLEGQLDSIFERLVPDETRDVISGFFARPLQNANLMVWEMIGLPIVNAIQLLSLLVLVIACVNYTNLATAQSFGRSREVGMRQTMGANRRQLLLQFLVESLTISAIAMVIAIAALEIIIPLFNNTSNKAMEINYLQTLPWLITTTAFVGLFAGAYPAWLITRTKPLDALRDIARKGKKGSKVRSVMIGTQFAISAFMLSLVTIVFMQNQKVEESSHAFPRSEVYTIGRLNVEGIRGRLDTLRHELEAQPNIKNVSFSSQVPFEQNNSTFEIAMQPGDEAGKIRMHQLSMTPEFLETYDIPLLEGRNLSRDIGNDLRGEESEVANVLVNEMALAKLGIDIAADAINQRIYRISEDSTLRELVIVGVVPTQNIIGLYNTEKPWVFLYQPSILRIGSVRFTGADDMEAVGQIENAWKRVVPEYPIQGRFLDEVFSDVYKILQYMNYALAGFAFVALSLAMIGLFGLAAFMATQRTREIGVRKVLGANSLQIAGLLIWQFSKPVIWALLAALPAAWFASKSYLGFFADRLETPIVILLVSGLIAVLLAWGTVAGHAIRISRSSPILALRYE
ncbi:MAG: FtsX-like permease family protein [Gammaproteobacteria bacterium]|nr:FtsX-like permease family protein [Gammaproteobacteria bacterium]